MFNTTQQIHIEPKIASSKTITAPHVPSHIFDEKAPVKKMPKVFLDQEKMFEIIPLRNDQQKLMEETGSAFFIRGAEKVNEYLKNNHDYFRLYKVPAGGCAIGALGGGAAGAGIGYLIANAPGAFIVGGIGAIAGGLSGAAVAKMYINVKVSNSDDYRKYLIGESKEIIEKYRDFLDENGKYNEFICPIALDFVDVPVRYPGHKRVYEEANITRWLKENPTGNNSPSREGHMKINKLYYDFNYFPELMKLLNSDAKNIFKRNINEVIDERMNTCAKSRLFVINKMLDEAYNLHRQAEGKKAKSFMQLINELKRERDWTKKLLSENKINTQQEPKRNDSKEENPQNKEITIQL